MQTQANIAGLVGKLTWVYQPIFRHPHLTNPSTWGGAKVRSCNDRLAAIVRCLPTDRTYRILDLGCSQGFFALSLAARGHEVIGIDDRPDNIELASAIAKKFELNATFRTALIEDIVEAIKPGDFDVVLALSVLHHLVHAHGQHKVRGWLDHIADCIGVAYIEWGVKTEPEPWAASMPSDERALMTGFDDLRILDHFMPSSPDDRRRPLYLCTRDPLTRPTRRRWA